MRFFRRTSEKRKAIFSQIPGILRGTGVRDRLARTDDRDRRNERTRSLLRPTIVWKKRKERKEKKFLNSSTIHPRSVSQARHKTVGEKYGKTYLFHRETRAKKKTKKQKAKKKKQKKRRKKMIYHERSASEILLAIIYLFFWELGEEMIYLKRNLARV